MLDRLSTEVLRAIIQEVSPSVWERKECLTQLGIVCISIRRAVKPIADEVVHVDRADAVAVIKRWPTACRKLVTTLLIGHDGTNTESKDALQIDERDLTRLLAALPAVNAVYVRNLAASPLPPDGVQAEAVTFATAQNNPFRKCTTLSIRDSRFYFESSLEHVKFALRHLHIGTLQQEPQNAPGSGLEQQFLTRKCLPHLETLRLSCHWLPRCTKDFLDKLSLIQIDLKADNLDWAVKLIQAGSLETSTPLLITYDESLIAHAPSPEIPGLKYIRLEPAHPYDILNTLEALPDLEAVFFAGTSTYRTGRLGEIDSSGEIEVREYLATSNFVVIPPQEGDSDGVEPAFSRYIRSRA